jgi:ABC-2 type transport system permease protein
MKPMKFNRKLLRYEMVNATSNMFTLIFGVAFPIFMSVLFSSMFSAGATAEEAQIINAGLYTTMIMMIPLATMFIGYAVSCAQEIEGGILQRFKLFGYRERTLLSAKMIANLIFMMAAVLLYTVFMFLALDIAAPNFWAFVSLILFVFLLAAALFVLSHAIASLIGRFGPTFGVTMALYFIFMTFGGMMGIEAHMLPSFLQIICKALPMYYISVEFLDFWVTGAYNFLPIVLSTLLLFALAFGMLGISVAVNKRRRLKPRKAAPIYYD